MWLTPRNTKLQTCDGSNRSKVANLLLKGLSNKEIGVRLGIQEKTVRWHLTWVYRKAGVKSAREYIVKELT